MRGLFPVRSCAKSLSLSEFQPPALLRNPHVQSALNSAGPRRWRAARRGAALLAASRDYLLDCGDGVRLLGHYSSPADEPKGLVVLLHGWEGSAASGYMLTTGARLLDAGFGVFRLNFRDHGPTHHLNEGIFHSCRLDEVVGAVRRVAELLPHRPLYLAGYSLGGNFTLRVALRAPGAGIPLARAVAICPVVDPAHGLMAMENGLGLYQHYFVKKWRRSLRRKQALFPHLYDLQPCLALTTVRGMTDWLVRHHSEFDTIEDYLRGYAVAGGRLAGLEVPATILTAEDDPIIPVADFHELELPDHAELVITRHGGHCGFIENLKFASWAERFLERELARAPR